MSLTPVVEVNGEVVYALQPKQLKAFQLTPLVRAEEGKRHVGYGGAAGGAKSHLARVVLAATALMWKGSTSIIFRRTFPELRDNHITKFLGEVPRDLYTWKASDKVVEWRNGSRTLFGYLERDDHVYQYQGPEYDLMVFEEATHYTWWQVSYLVNSRLRATVDGSVPFALYPSNPGNVGHAWYKRLFIDRDYREGEDPADYGFVQARVEDNLVLMERDPGYVKKLNALPEPLRSQLKDGDWSAGLGLALPDLTRKHHLVPAFDVPEHWYRWSAFDWGFNHPFVFGHFAADGDGNAFLVDTVRGRHLHDPEIIERIQSNPLIRWGPRIPVHSGHDSWNEYRSRLERTPTTAETFAEAGMPLTKANISRVSGLRNLRHYVRVQENGPRFRIMDTPANLEVFRCLESIPTDPDNIEDALKIDADEFGFGGDDDYDMVRYGLAARPLAAKDPPPPPIPDSDNYDTKFEELMKRLTASGSGRGF